MEDEHGRMSAVRRDRKDIQRYRITVARKSRDCRHWISSRGSHDNAAGMLALMATQQIHAASGPARPARMRTFSWINRIRCASVGSSRQATAPSRRWCPARHTRFAGCWLLLMQPSDLRRSDPRSTFPAHLDRHELRRSCGGNSCPQMPLRQPDSTTPQATAANIDTMDCCANPWSSVDKRANVVALCIKGRFWQRHRVLQREALIDVLFSDVSESRNPIDRIHPAS